MESKVEKILSEIDCSIQPGKKAKKEKQKNVKQQVINQVANGNGNIQIMGDVTQK